MNVSRPSDVWKHRRATRVWLPVGEAAAATCCEVVSVRVLLSLPEKAFVALWSRFPFSLGQGSSAFIREAVKSVPYQQALRMQQSLTRAVYCPWLKITQKPMADFQRSLPSCPFLLGTSSVCVSVSQSIWFVYWLNLSYWLIELLRFSELFCIQLIYVGFFDLQWWFPSNMFNYHVEFKNFI